MVDLKLEQNEGILLQTTDVGRYDGNNELEVYELYLTTGPLDINILKQMAIAGQFKPNSLVWKPGMENWLRADAVDDLKDLFNNVMPPIPTTEE